MHVLDFYRSAEGRDDLAGIFNLGAQNHPDGLPDFFLEKDVWVTEVLHLLFNENLLGDYAVAFKGGTALSKCWRAIDRFSEDIDLSIHWADLADVDDEKAAWKETTKSRSQNSKFRKIQKDKLVGWSTDFAHKLNQRLQEYGIQGLGASLDEDSGGEKVRVHFPVITNANSQYHLDHVLLEFGGRNRGQPTIEHSIDCYAAHVPELKEIVFPTATVQAYDPAYILWEKLTALHQFATMDKEPTIYRLARHWYDVDCILRKHIADPMMSAQAMKDVVEMKATRWAEAGVEYEAVLNGELKLIPEHNRLEAIATDHKNSIVGRMFFTHCQPDNFEQIIGRLSQVQDDINRSLLSQI